MSQVIYLKEQIGNAVFDRKGSVIPFHEVGGDFGGIKLDTERDAETIEDIEGHIKNRTGGIWKANEAEYLKKKTLPLWKQSMPQSEPIRAFKPRTSPVVGDAAAVDKPAQPAPGPYPPAPPISPLMGQMLTQPGLSVPGKQEGGEPAQVPAAPAVKPRMGRRRPAEKTEPVPAAA